MKFNLEPKLLLFIIFLISLGALLLLIFKFNFFSLTGKSTLPKGEFYQGESFSFRYPKGFKEMSLENLQKIDSELKIGLENSKGQGRFLLKVKKGKPEVESMEELEEKLTQQMKKELVSFEKIKWEEIEISGKKSLDYYYAYKLKNESIKQRMILILAENNIYYLTFSAPKEKYDAYKEDFDLIISTFKI